jgi:hypothetical protein
MRRRTFLQILGGGVAALGIPFPLRALAEARETEFFVFIHAAGGWDVTLWSDPRNERQGLIEPPSSKNTDYTGIKHWKPVRLEGDTVTFAPIEPSGTSLRLGPAIGELLDLRDRISIINGIAMNTVSHDDGTTYSATGRHRSGGAVPQSSIDVVFASALGTMQLMPDVSIRFPSHFAGRVDQRAVPLVVANVEAITKSFKRSDAYLTVDDRDAMAAVLAEEAADLARGSQDADSFIQLQTQHQALPRLLDGEFTRAFSAAELQSAHPQFDYRGRTQGANALSAAFAVEAMRRNVVRCVAFALGGLDTHTQNYRQHAHTLQELFGVVATLIKRLDETPHPTLSGAKLADHTHVLVISEFCRTPAINLAGGRDHYPNNSALVISPRFKGGRTFGTTDREQLLPTEIDGFVGGRRPIAPPDVLATFAGAFGIDPRAYMRDGEIIHALLA